VNKLVLILFVVVLLVALGIGGFYLFQTQGFSFSNLLPSSYIPIEEAKQKASENCKNTGFSTMNIEDKADNYLVAFIKKLGTNKSLETGKIIKSDIYLRTIDLGNTCWGVWAGGKNGNGTLFWEDGQGKTNQIKTKIQI
jgi:hypothetical protein